MPFMTTEELQQLRCGHEESLRLLFERSDSWSRADRIRGAATIENLTQQLEAINNELQMAGAA